MLILRSLQYETTIIDQALTKGIQSDEIEKVLLMMVSNGELKRGSGKRNIHNPGGTTGDSEGR